MDSRAALGRSGEDAAARLYRRLGFRVLDRNYRRPEGEIDLVAAAGRTVVFCEVKTRTSERWGVPAEAVSPAKQARIRRLAGRWLRERRPGRVQVRFDVVSVVARDGAPAITHIPEAF